MIMEAVDRIAYDGRINHSMTAVEKWKVIPIYVRDKVWQIGSQ